MLRLVSVALILLVSSRSYADPFADAARDSTGQYSVAYTLTKLTTWKLGKKCQARLADKNEGAIHAAGYYGRDIAEYAKAVTGDDWSAIEGSDNTSREANKDKIAAKIEAFKSKFGITVIVEGDDCDAKQGSMWLSAWSGLATSIKNNPPPNGKVFVTLTATSKAKDVTVDVKDNTTFTITMPKDIEPAGAWQDKLDKPFRKAASGIAEDHVFSVKESTGRYSSAWVLTKLTTFKLGKKCLAKIGDKESEFTHTAGFYTRDILEYAKAVGGDDWDRIEQQSSGDPKSNRALVEKSMDDFKKRFSLTVTVEGDDCDAKSGSLWLKFWSQVATTLKNYPPKANKVAITINITPKAKDVSVTGSKDGGTWTITAPRDVEPTAWTEKFDAPFKKVARKL